jgi:hypothetical protein
MKVLGWLRAVVAVILGLVIGLAVTGVVNILHPAENIGWALAATLLSAVLSAMAGFLMAGQRRNPPAALPKEPAEK